MNIQFDVNTAPPSQEAIDCARSETESRVARLLRLQRWVGYAGMALVLAVLAVLAVLLSLSKAEFVSEGRVFVLAGVMIVVVAMAAGGAVGRAVAMAAGGAVGVAVGGAVGGAVIVGALAVLFGFGLIVEVLSGRRSQAEEQRDALVELGESTPEECVKFVELVDADQTIAAYQQQLAAMGRKPVIGEYKAALEWIVTAEARPSESDKQERARLACERLAAKA